MEEMDEDDIIFIRPGDINSPSNISTKTSERITRFYP